MLSSLTIQNIVLIEKMRIDFQSGLCALTGETGAGKSILLDSLGLALGGRSESRLLRKGEEKAQVTAEFEITDDHPAHDMLKVADLESDQTLYLRRTLNADGRTKAYINDQPVSANLLKQIGQSLVEIHGQFDTQGLLDSATHRGVLDEYAKAELEPMNVAWAGWRAAEKKLQIMKEQAESARREESYLREALEDLDALGPQKGEEQDLASLRERLMSREQVLESLSNAYQVLSFEQDPVRSAWGILDKIADKIGSEGEEIINALDRASADIQDAVASIQSLSADLQESEHNLQSIDDRLFGLRAQARKHDCGVDDLPDVREELAEKLNAIEHEEDVMADLMRQVDQARGAYVTLAQGLHVKRVAAAQELDGLIAHELPPLKLEKAKFVTQVTELSEAEWGSDGMSKVAFLVATNPGAEPGPLGKIASGGEMSRFMLALKVVMAEGGCVPSMIFDEVDSGIGGSTADAVGERLARLGEQCQVLVVTHSPQVAARAAHQWIVQKSGEDDLRTSVLALDNDKERQDEIARMLAGAEITPEARAAADKLLELGRSQKRAA